MLLSRTRRESTSRSAVGRFALRQHNGDLYTIEYGFMLARGYGTAIQKVHYESPMVIFCYGSILAGTIMYPKNQNYPYIQ